MQKIGGGNWRCFSRVDAFSPGFETNDLGCGSGGDQLRQSSMIGFEQHRAGGVFQTCSLTARLDYTFSPTCRQFSTPGTNVLLVKLSYRTGGRPRRSLQPTHQP